VTQTGSSASSTWKRKREEREREKIAHPYPLGGCQKPQIKNCMPIFSCTYTPMMKFSLSVRHSKRLTITANNKIEQL
jgi:hypothetical protein